MEEALCVVEVAGDVTTITLNRSGGGNALSGAMAQSLTAALTAARGAGSRSIVLRAAGRHLSTGGDVGALAELAGLPPAERVAVMDALLRAAEPMVRGLVELPMPLVVACRGTVAGGALALVLAADVVLADETAVFRFSHLAVGVPPDAGVSWLLPRIVGFRRAFALIGERITLDAESARELGLVTRICDRSTLWQQASAIALNLAEVPPGAMSATKRLLGDVSGSLERQLAAEREAVLSAVQSECFPRMVGRFLAALGSTSR